jgi:hypothetical protein
MIATIDCWSKNLSKFPKISSWHHEIDAELEPFLRPCTCQGRFKKGASPRCPTCKEALSAEYAAEYIERNAPGTAKGWRWQRDWNGLYCMAIENSIDSGTLRRIEDPYLD